MEAPDSGLKLANAAIDLLHALRRAEFEDALTKSRSALDWVFRCVQAGLLARSRASKCPAIPRVIGDQNFFGAVKTAQDFALGSGRDRCRRR